MLPFHMMQYQNRKILPCLHFLSHKHMNHSVFLYEKPHHYYHPNTMAVLSQLSHSALPARLPAHHPCHQRVHLRGNQRRKRRYRRVLLHSGAQSSLLRLLHVLCLDHAGHRSPVHFHWHRPPLRRPERRKAQDASAEIIFPPYTKTSPPAKTGGDAFLCVVALAVETAVAERQDEVGCDHENVGNVEKHHIA